MGRPAKTPQQYAAEFPELAFDANQNILFCSSCRLEVTPSANRINEHLASKSHQRLSAKKPKIIPFLKKSTKITKVHQFVECLIKSYVPLNAIDCALGDFMRQNFIQTLPASQACSIKYVNELYEDKMESIKERISNGQLVALIIDETPDKFHRCVVGLLAVFFDQITFEKHIKLLNLCITDHVSSEMINMIVNESLEKFEININNVPAFNSDSASYMKKFFNERVKESKIVFCTAHLINVLVNDLIKKIFSNIDEILVSVSSMFSSGKNFTCFATISSEFGLKTKKCPSLAPHRWFSRHDIMVFIYDYWIVFEKMSSMKAFVGKKMQKVQNLFSNQGICSIKIQFYTLLQFLAEMKRLQLIIESGDSGQKMYKILGIDVPTAIEKFNSPPNVEQMQFLLSQVEKEALKKILNEGQITLDTKWKAIVDKHIDASQQDLWSLLRTLDPKNKLNISFENLIKIVPQFCESVDKAKLKAQVSHYNA